MLLYTKELVAPRPNQQQGLLQFKPRPPGAKYVATLRNAFAMSTIHGMQYVCEGHRIGIRFFWLIIVLMGVASCFVTGYFLLQSQNEHQLVCVVATTQYPVYNINFPAVALCPWNHVNWLRSEKAARRILPRNADASMREAFHELLLVMTELRFGKFQSLGEISKRNLSSLSDISLSKLSDYLAYRCDEIFLPHSCYFDETEYDCCQLFVPEHTQHGICLVFNSLISEDSRKKKLVNEYYPFKVSTAGENSGLQFVLHLNKSFLHPAARLPFAMTLMIKGASEWSNYVVHQLYPQTENFLSVSPALMQTSTNTHKLGPSKRRCYFDNERHPLFPYNGLPYTRSNCVANCLQEAVRLYCNCTMPQYLPVIAGTRECNVLDFQCLYRNKDVFAFTKPPSQDKYIREQGRGRTCNCLPSCNSQLYETSLSTRLFQNMSVGNEIYRGIRVSVFYAQRVVQVYETKMKYTTYDWYAGFGGILGLYLGASGLSFFEVVYIGVRLMYSVLKDVYAMGRSKL